MILNHVDIQIKNFESDVIVLALAGNSPCMLCLRKREVMLIYVISEAFGIGRVTYCRTAPKDPKEAVLGEILLFSAPRLCSNAFCSFLFILDPLTAYLNEFLHMFLVKNKAGVCSLVCRCNLESRRAEVESICSDLNVFKSILVHLVSNTIKYSNEDLKIEIIFTYKLLLILMSKLTGYLFVSIKTRTSALIATNTKLEVQDLNKASFAQTHFETSGEAISLSTAYQQANFLDGNLSLSFRDS
jgi:hypothetical protein